MYKYLRILFATIFILGLGVAARAQTADAISVCLPFDFVAEGQALPAGTYKVEKTSNDEFGPLLLTNRSNGRAFFVSPFKRVTTASLQPEVKFSKVSGRLYLSAIRTPQGVYNLRTPRAPIAEATARLSVNGAALSGSGEN